jgi:hypothetical protein
MALAVFLAESPTELTTSATDAVLAMECLVIMVCLRRAAPVNHWRTGLWCWVFGLLAFSAILGAVIHGFVLPSSTRAALWLPLYLSLGVLVALFMVGAIYDWQGRMAATRLVPWSIGVGVAFFGLTQFFSGGFGLFVVYEALVMVSALAIYLRLAATHRLKGAGVIAAAIVLNLLAAGLQASHVSVRLLFQFDHNGLYHLVQMIATATLGLGLGLGLGSPTRTDADYFS